jgi:hypothetical protein
MERAERLRTLAPQLVADVRLYSTEEGGRRTAAPPGWGCPCTLSRDEPLVGYDAWPILGNDAIGPGEERRLGFVFLSPEGLESARRAGAFFLWEGRFIGEARVVEAASPNGG